jgi:hypothetical protein
MQSNILDLDIEENMSKLKKKTGYHFRTSYNIDRVAAMKIPNTKARQVSLFSQKETHLMQRMQSNIPP